MTWGKLEYVSQDIIDALAKYGKTTDDIRWIGSRDGTYAMSWADFVSSADIEYSWDWHTNVLARNLVVVGADWWMRRPSPDYAYEWVYHEQPKMCDRPKSFQKIIGNDDDTLASLNDALTA